MKKTFLHLILGTLIASAFYSCNAPKRIAYFQDVANRDTTITIDTVIPLTVRSGDKLLIVVNSSIPEMAAVFNLPVVGYRVGVEQTSTPTSSNNNVMSYIVGSNGCIDFPVLGNIKVEGLQRSEIAELIKNRLVSENLCNDAVVNVELSNAYINVLGEVKNPGRYLINNDNFTVFDAISMAGDLTIQGVRYNILVARKSGKEAHIYKLDLTNMEQVLSSPGYYLQQGDVVYAEPNSYRKRQTTVNGNNVLSASFWISVTSLAATITTTISLLISRTSN